MSENGSNCSIEEIQQEEIEEVQENMSKGDGPAVTESAAPEPTPPQDDSKKEVEDPAPVKSEQDVVDDPPLDELLAPAAPKPAESEPAEPPTISVVAPAADAAPAPAAPVAPTPAPSSGQSDIVVLKRPDDEDLDDEEDDEEIDETLSERLIGLTEMFPEFVRDGSVTLVKNSWSFSKSTYNFVRSAAWVVFSTATILFMPVMIETERLAFQDQQKQQKTQMLLGPGVAHSGGPALGPPPI